MVDVKKIYNSRKWRRVRIAQLERDHYECQRCKRKGKYKDVPGIITYTKATLVHHDFRVERYPQYAYNSMVNGKRNLYSLCQSCHEIEHEEERGMIEKPHDLNEERW